MSGTAQLQSCHDTIGCGGNEVSGVSTARDCCLGSGFSFRNDGSPTCQQCIGEQLLGAALDKQCILSKCHFLYD